MSKLCPGTEPSTPVATSVPIVIEPGPAPLEADTALISAAMEALAAKWGTTYGA